MTTTLIFCSYSTLLFLFARLFLGLSNDTYTVLYSKNMKVYYFTYISVGYNDQQMTLDGKFDYEKENQVKSILWWLELALCWYLVATKQYMYCFTCETNRNHTIYKVSFIWLKSQQIFKNSNNKKILEKEKNVEAENLSMISWMKK